MPRKSTNELIAQAAATLPDNVTELISAADVRLMVEDFINAIKPGYGVMYTPGPHVQVVNIAPSLLTFTNLINPNPTEVTVTPATGSILRAERGTSRITLQANMNMAANRECTITLYKNGVVQPWQIKGYGSGATQPAAVNMVAVDYADPAADYTFQVSADVNGTSVTFTNVTAVLEIVAVNSFV